MGYLSGELVVELKKIDGKSEYEHIPGSDFGLEEGGDWEYDKDEGIPKAGFLLISFQDNYDAVVHFGMYGDRVTHFNVEIRISNAEALKDDGIQKVRVFEDKLEVNVTAPDEVDY